VDEIGLFLNFIWKHNWDRNFISFFKESNVKLFEKLHS